MKGHGGTGQSIWIDGELSWIYERSSKRAERRRFCRDCLSLPVVGRHHPLVPTVKKSFPPKPKPAPAQVSRSTSVKKAVKRSPSIISATVESPTAKRLRPTDDPGPSYRAWSQPGNDFRMDNLSLVIGDRAVGKPEGSAGPNGAEVQSGRPETKPGTTPKSEAASMAAPDEDESNNKVAPEDKEGKDESSSSSRPKRQAAMNRPDYHALHHHISTPTARWLDLIHDPDKYGVIIKDGWSGHRGKAGADKGLQDHSRHYLDICCPRLG